MSRLCWLMSVSATSISANSGTHRMSVKSFRVKPTLPAPMMAILKLVPCSCHRLQPSCSLQPSLCERTVSGEPEKDCAGWVILCCATRGITVPAHPRTDNSCRCCRRRPPDRPASPRQGRSASAVVCADRENVGKEIAGLLADRVHQPRRVSASTLVTCRNSQLYSMLSRPLAVRPCCRPRSQSAACSFFACAQSSSDCRYTPLMKSSAAHAAGATRMQHASRRRKHKISHFLSPSRVDQTSTVSPTFGVSTLVAEPSMPATNFSGVWSIIGNVA